MTTNQNLHHLFRKPIKNKNTPTYAEVFGPDVPKMPSDTIQVPNPPEYCPAKQNWTIDGVRSVDAPACLVCDHISTCAARKQYETDWQEWYQAMSKWGQPKHRY